MAGMDGAGVIARFVHGYLTVRVVVGIIKINFNAINVIDVIDAVAGGKEGISANRAEV